MNQGVKIAAIIGGAMIVAAALVIYFSPYQSCVRADVQSRTNNGTSVSDAEQSAHIFCATHR
jgi:hypothetical protein